MTPLSLRPDRALAAGLGLLALVLVAPAADAARDPLVCVPNGDYVQPPVAPAPVERNTGLGMNVWEGATPPGLDPALPQLVLVHGLHGSAHGWFGETMLHGRNDFYDHVYAAGFKAWMVDLWDARDIPNPAEDGIDNGKLLKSQVEWIVGQEGISMVNVIAHSKGGVDSNIAALMGAPIDTIATISGAHWGSPLADLAQDDLWPDFLQDLIGYNDDGTKFMQTGCMNLIRQKADGFAGNDDLSIHTFSGTDWGPDFSYLALAGAYLGTWFVGACPEEEGIFNFDRPNDGVVCVAHALHPWGRRADGVVDGKHRIVFDDQTSGENQELDHDNIRMGAPQPEDDSSCHATVFDSVRPYIEVFHGAGPVPDSRPADTGRRVVRRELGHVLRGGELVAGRGRTTIPVEPGVRALQLSTMLTSAEIAVEAISPSGHTVRLPRAERMPAGSPLGQPWISAARLPDPEPGLWTVRFGSRQPGAWGVVAGLEGGVRLALTHPSLIDAGGALSLDLDGPAAAFHGELVLTRTPVDGAREAVTRIAVGKPGELRADLPGPGVYHARLTVRGESAAGGAFERSVVFSVGVDGAGRAPQALPEACR